MHIGKGSKLQKKYAFKLWKICVIKLFQTTERVGQFDFGANKSDQKARLNKKQLKREFRLQKNEYVSSIPASKYEKVDNAPKIFIQFVSNRKT